MSNLEFLENELSEINMELEILLERKQELENQIKNIKKQEKKSGSKILIDDELNRLKSEMGRLSTEMRRKRTFRENFDYERDMIHKVHDEIQRLGKMQMNGKKYATSKLSFEKPKEKKEEEQKIIDESLSRTMSTTQTDEEKMTKIFKKTVKKLEPQIKKENKLLIKPKKKRVKRELTENDFSDSNDIELLHKFYKKTFKNKFPNDKVPLPRTRPKINFNPYNMKIEESNNKISHDDYKHLLKKQIILLLENRKDEQKYIYKGSKIKRKKYTYKKTKRTKKEIWEEYKKLYDNKFPNTKRTAKQTDKKNKILEELNKLL